jgi:hypothetical protein
MESGGLSRGIMAGSERSEPGVWQRLRRRRVTRTVVSYLSMGFAALEAVWFSVPRYGLGDGVVRIVMGALVLGFPLAVVLAWTYDLTPHGIVRTPDDEGPETPDVEPARLRRWAWLVLCAGAVAGGLVLRALRL